MNRLPSRSVALPDTIASANGFKTSIATAATPQTYTAGQINGATGLNPVALTVGSGSSTTGRLSVLPSVTLSSNAGSYVNGSKITFTGLDTNGNTRTSVATIVGTDGGITVHAGQGLVSVSQIAVEAQTNTGGAFTFGWTHVSCPGARGLRAGGTGSVKLGFADGGTDTIIGLVAGEKLDLAFEKLYSDAASPATKVSLLFGD